MRSLLTAVRRVLPALILPLVCMACPHTGRAEGALAIGLPADVAKQGVAMGWVINYPTREEAHAQALRHCREFKDAAEATRGLCKVIEAFRDRCVAIALDPEYGTPGVGWAVAASQPTAERSAMDKCLATAGRDRQAFCRVTITRCDGGR